MSKCKLCPLAWRISHLIIKACSHGYMLCILGNKLKEQRWHREKKKRTGKLIRLEQKAFLSLCWQTPLVDKTERKFLRSFQRVQRIKGILYAVLVCRRYNHNKQQTLLMECSAFTFVRLFHNHYFIKCIYKAKNLLSIIFHKVGYLTKVFFSL